LVTDYHVEYYSSMDPACEMGHQDHDQNISVYTSSYGSCPTFLSDIVETASHYLVHKEQQRHNYYVDGLKMSKKRASKFEILKKKLIT